MNSIRLKVIFLFFLPMVAVAAVRAQQVDYGVIMNVTLRKQIDRHWDAAVQQNVWLKYDARRIERSMNIAAVNYSIWKNYLKLSAQYFYIHQFTRSRKINDRHRYQLGFTGYYRYWRFNLSLYSRFESTYTRKAANNPVNKWRNWLTVYYTPVGDWVWRPYVSVDLFNKLNDPKKNGIDQTWYAGGVEYRIDQNHTLDFRLRAHHVTSKTPHTLDWMFGVFYKIRI